MARINIEDSIYQDQRFIELMIKLGGVDFALGAVTRAWSIAQSFWLINGVGIPTSVWKLQKLRPELIEVGLAEERGDFIYVRGSEEQFAWLNQRSDAGKKGGKVPKKPSREIIEDSGNREQSGAIGSKPLTLSPSLSLKQNKEEELNLSPCFEAWGETLTRYRIQKDPRADEFTILRLVKTHGVEKTVLALRGYGHQQSFDNYDPKKYCRITHLLKPDKFELCVNLGAQQTVKPKWEPVSNAIQPDK